MLYTSINIHLQVVTAINGWAPFCLVHFTPSVKKINLVLDEIHFSIINLDREIFRFVVL